MEAYEAGGTQVIKSTGLISGLNFLGIAAAVIADVLLAAYFGAGASVDAFFVAFAVPQLASSILLVSCNSAFVPIFSRFLSERESGDVWHLFSIIANYSLLLLAPVALLGMLFSPVIVRLSAPGLETGTIQLAIRLNRLLLLTVLPAGLVATLGALLNSFQRFAAPAAAAFFRYGAVCLVTVLLAKGCGIDAVAWGHIVGVACQVLVLGAMTFRIGAKYHLCLDHRYPGVRRAARLLWPPLVGGSMGQSNMLVERFLASFFPAGTVSAVGYARRLLLATNNIVFGSVSTALLPRLSGESSRGDMTGLKAYSSLGIKLVSLISIPLVAGAVVLSTPLVRVLFERGAFQERATSLIALMVSLYFLSTIPWGIRQMLQATYYAMQDTLTPMYFRLANLGTTIILDILLITVMGAPGLALAFTLAIWFESGGLFWILRHRIGPLGGRLVSYFAKVGTAALVMGLTTFVFKTWFEGASDMPIFWRSASELAIAASLGIAAYGSAVVLLDVKEASDTMRSAARKAVSMRREGLLRIWKRSSKNR